MASYSCKCTIPEIAEKQFIEKVRELRGLLVMIQTGEIEIIQDEDMINVIDVFYFNNVFHRFTPDRINDTIFCEDKDRILIELLYEVSKEISTPSICATIRENKKLNDNQITTIYSKIAHNKLSLLEILILLAPTIRDVEHNDFGQIDEKWLSNFAIMNFQHISHINLSTIPRIKALQADAYGVGSKIGQIIKLHEDELVKSDIYKTKLRRRMGWLAHYAWSNYSTGRGELSLS